MGKINEQIIKAILYYVDIMRNTSSNIKKLRNEKIPHIKSKKNENK